MSEFFCRTCVLHDRATVVVSDGPPDEPCPFEGDGEDSCERTEWTKRTWYCVSCRNIGRTTIVESDTNPTRCPEFRNIHKSFLLTKEAAYVFQHRAVG